MNNSLKFTAALLLIFSIFINPSIYAENINGTLDSVAEKDSIDAIKLTSSGETNLSEAQNEPVRIGSRRSQALEEDADVESPTASIPDPLEPLNRFFFQFNDKLYLFVLKPVSNVYKFIIPEEPRICLSNFFYNLIAPIRIVNCLLQGKVEAAGNELLRFVVNSTAGVGGLADPATYINIPSQKEDLGQTLAVYGLDHGFYLNLPVLGPTSARDGIGRLGDSFLDPVTYMFDSDGVTISVTAVKLVNDFSVMDEYEKVRETAIDPYIAVREAYSAYRKSLVEN